MAKCGYCGAELPEGTNFCPGCGKPVPAAVPQAPLPPGSPVPPPPVPPPVGMPGVVPAPGAPVAAVRPANKGMSRGAKVALIVGISIVLLTAAVIVVAVVFFVGAISAPADVANKFVEAVNEGDLSTAWGYFSSEARKEETRANFDSVLGELEGGIEGYNTSSVEVSNGNAQIEMDIEYEDGGSETWDMALIKEDGEWKILNIE